MGSVNAAITYKEKGKIHKVSGQRLIFSAHRCFELNGDRDDLKCIEMIADFLKGKPGLAIAGTGPFAEYLLKQAPQLKKQIKVVIQNDWKIQHTEFAGLPVCDLGSIPKDVKTVFIAETLSGPRMNWRTKLKDKAEIFDTEILREIDPLKIPMRAWSKDPDCIYPMDFPDVEFDSGKDFILIDCPARNLALMPNGLAYVHNALKKTSLNFQTVDLDIIAYHRYHSYRLLDAKGPILTPTGREMHSDPWLAEAYMEWLKEDTISYFRPYIEEVAAKLIKAKPKILGCSVQGCNINFTRELVQKVKAALPEIIIVGGGYSAYQPNVARTLFPEADYLCIGEADITAPQLLESLKKGEFPRDIPGVLSVYDTPGRKYQVGGMPHELDTIEMAKYDWTDLSLYRNHNHYQLTPIIATRGCRWSKCTFCGERFFWRARSPKMVVDEFEYLHDNGCDLFMFNESDLNGNPKILLEICEEIQRRKLKIRLTGQLRISRHSDRKFFDALVAGGFTALRFGVDAWSENTLKLQKKGYTVPMISQNLKDCWEAGIYTEVNTVIGIPGETDEDIDRTVELKGICKPHIGRVANINKLMLIHGSVYWEEPEKLGIKFRGDKDELYKKYPAMIPTELWYSDQPYIDEAVRVERFQRVIEGMGKLGYDIGPFAMQNIEKIDKGHADDKMGRDGRRYVEWEQEDNGNINAKDKRSSEMRVDSVIENVVVSTEAPLRIFASGGEFYGLFPETKQPAPIPNTLDNVVGLATPPAHQRIRQISTTGLRLLREEGLKAFVKRAAVKIVEVLPAPAQKVARTSWGMVEVWRGQGAGMAWFRVISKLQHLRVLIFSGGGLEEGQVVIKRDYIPVTEMIDKDFHGYIILKIRDTFYAVHRLFPFDKDQADRGEYPKGKCFTARTAREVVFQIEEQLGLNKEPAFHSPAKEATV